MSIDGVPWVGLGCVVSCPAFSDGESVFPWSVVVEVVSVCSRVLWFGGLSIKSVSIGGVSWDVGVWAVGIGDPLAFSCFLAARGVSLVTLC